MRRNKFSLSNYKLFSCDLGELIPCGLQEVLPGDTIQCSSSALVRMSPLLAPVMHPLHARIHHWYVPNRLIWEDWEDFITGGPDGLDASTYPTITFGSGVSVGDLADYLGVPVTGASITVSALPFRAYNFIYNEWYRDQDLVDPLVFSKASGNDTTTETALQQVAWERDYFTTARPFEQKGPAITLPLGTEAPVLGIGNSDQNYTTGPIAVYETDASGTRNYADYRGMDSGIVIEEDPNNAGFPYVRADLSNATAASVNDLREAFALQRYEEARARYGSRYTEYLRYLGVKSSDARLDRPEYWGGAKQTIQFSEVLQTAEGTNPVGELRGHGIGAMRSNRYRRYVEEHGWMLSFISLRPKTIYTQGLQRHWNRRTKEDFHQRELEHIGQQELENKEIYAAHSDPDGVFGYQDRYDEYRHAWSSVAGEFRTSTLDFWHMARDFSTDPALNADFINCVPDPRIFAASTNDTVYAMVNHSIQARRALSKTGHSFIY